MDIIENLDHEIMIDNAIFKPTMKNENLEAFNDSTKLNPLFRN